MRKSCLHVALAALLGILWLAAISTALHAETGSVAVVFTKGGLILGVGRGDRKFYSDLGAADVRSRRW